MESSLSLRRSLYKKVKEGRERTESGGLGLAKKSSTVDDIALDKITVDNSKFSLLGVVGLQSAATVQQTSECASKPHSSSRSLAFIFS